MDYMKDGKKRSEFWPKQDLANDPKGQEQASQLARGAILRIALGKMTDNQKLIKVMMDLWSGMKMEDRNQVPVIEVLSFFENGLPDTFSDKEKELVGELKKLIED